MKSTFYFSRIRLTVDINYSDKTLLLYSGLDGKYSIVYRNDNFRFVETRTTENSYIVGKIIKYKPEQTEKFLDETQNKVADRDVKNKVLASIRFIIQPESGILIHEEDVSYIPQKAFLIVFKELFEKNLPPESTTSITVSPITEVNSFFTRISEIKEIKKIDIRLVPANPSSSDIWKKIQEKLKTDKITNYREVQENKKIGEGITVDQETEAKMHMSEDGYGVSKVEGIGTDGHITTISTKDTNVNVKQRIEIGDEEIEELIPKFNSKLQEIVSRTLPRNQQNSQQPPLQNEP